MAEENQRHYLNGDTKIHPDRRQNWDKCGHHQALENKVDDTNQKVNAIAAEMREGFKKIESEMNHMKITNTAYDERIGTIFKVLKRMEQINEKTYFVVIGTLISAIGTLAVLILTGKVGG